MITSEGVFSDYEAILKDEKLSEVAKLVACMRIVLKVLVNIRSNQTLPEKEKERLFADAQKKRAVADAQQKSK